MEHKTIRSCLKRKIICQIFRLNEKRETHSIGADQEGGVGSFVLAVAGVMDDALPGKRERLEGDTVYNCYIDLL